MPKITEPVDGRELSFSPIRLEHFRRMQALEEDKMKWTERIDFWMPIIEESIKEAGSGPLPDIEKMNIEKAMEVFGQLLAGLLEASGVKRKEVAAGEVAPDPASVSSAATSTVSS